jgi:hypothetical protein
LETFESCSSVFKNVTGVELLRSVSKRTELKHGELERKQILNALKVTSTLAAVGFTPFDIW